LRPSLRAFSRIFDLVFMSILRIRKTYWSNGVLEY